MRICRNSYNPFQLGGNLNKQIATEIENPEFQSLGMGFRGVYIEENGKGYVFEKESGGLVGDTLEQVRDDISKCGDIPTMCEQVLSTIESFKNAQLVTYKQFFSLF